MGKFINLLNKKFGNWTVVSREKNNKSGCAHWLCKCKCGIEKVIRSTHLLSGASKSCGCSNIDDKLGKQFGKWTVISKDNNKGKGQGQWWKCKCECGIEKSILSGSLASGSSTSCGSCWQRKETHITATNSLYTSYKRLAKKKNRKFDLTKEEFRKLITSNCFYCNKKPNQIFKVKPIRVNNKDRVFKYNGIDRKNNATGYYKENCVGCCRDCNTSKSTLTISEWLKHIKRILKCYKN